MVILNVHIERNDDNSLFVRSRNSDAPETDQDFSSRQIDYLCLEGTCIPGEHRLRAGALISAILHFPLPEPQYVFLIDLVHFHDFAVWNAEALIDEDGRTLTRRGVGTTPVEALVDLLFNIQQR